MDENVQVRDILLTAIDIEDLQAQVDEYNEEGWQVKNSFGLSVRGLNGVDTQHLYAHMQIVYIDYDGPEEEETEEEGHNAENDERVVPMRMTGR